MICEARERGGVGQAGSERLPALAMQWCEAPYNRTWTRGAATVPAGRIWRRLGKDRTRADAGLLRLAPARGACRATTHQLVLAAEAGRREVLVKGVHLRGTGQRQQPLPRAVRVLVCTAGQADVPCS
jgi:hypothetical protein